MGAAVMARGIEVAAEEFVAHPPPFVHLSQVLCRQRIVS
jgi:hypothetical protein